MNQNIWEYSMSGSTGYPRYSTLCLWILERNMDWARTLCVSSRACLYLRPAPERLEFSKKNVGIKYYYCAARFDTAPCGTVFGRRLNGQLLTALYGLLRWIMCMWLHTHVSRLTPTTISLKLRKCTLLMADLDGCCMPVPTENVFAIKKTKTMTTTSLQTVQVGTIIIFVKNDLMSSGFSEKNWTLRPVVKIHPRGRSHLPCVKLEIIDKSLRRVARISLHLVYTTMATKGYLHNQNHCTADLHNGQARTSGKIFCYHLDRI